MRKRLYVGYRNSGWTAEFDIADPAHPKLVWSFDFNPPNRGPHTVSPIVYDTVPNSKDAGLRRFAFVVDEAGGTADMKPCPEPVRAGSYMLDITNESKPVKVSSWYVPVVASQILTSPIIPNPSAPKMRMRPRLPPVAICFPSAEKATLKPPARCAWQPRCAGASSS